MGKILDVLYAEELHPANSVIQGYKEYDEMYRESLKEMERFTKRLGEDTRAEFDILMKHYPGPTFMEESHTFNHEFRLGTGIVCGVFCKNGRDQAWSISVAQEYEWGLPINQSGCTLLCKNRLKLLINIDDDGESDMLNYVFVLLLTGQDNDGALGRRQYDFVQYCGTVRT